MPDPTPRFPEYFDNWQEEYRAALESAALFDQSHRSKLEVSGPEAGMFLQNLCTNDVKSLPIGAGCEALFTTLKAKIVAHAYIFHLLLGDQRSAYWLDAAQGQAEKIIKHLDHHLISEQVEFADRTQEFAQLHLAGPKARAVLQRALQAEIPELGRLEHMVRTFGAADTCHLRNSPVLGVSGYDVVCLKNRASHIWNYLQAAGAKPAGAMAWESLRIEAGTPVISVDFDENTLAMELDRIKETICYSKGCFLGQEPIVRARDIGHVNRTLQGLRIEGADPVSRGSKISRDGKEVGWVTSSAYSPKWDKSAALGYLRRGNTELGTKLEIEFEDSRRIAEVVAFHGRAGTNL
jgi:folate-binding protein YgfZ